MNEPVYPTVDPAELEPEYSEHHQWLLNNSVPLLDIAAKLALRDREIARLNQELDDYDICRGSVLRKNLESERDAALARARDADAVRDSLNAMVRQLDDATEPDTFDAEAIERVLGTAAWNDQLTVVKADTVRAWLGKITALESRIRELTGWRPMETAPRNTRILTRMMGDHVRDVVISTFVDCEEISPMFTGWLPLPEVTRG